MTQIYTAYSTFCALVLAADAIGHNGSLYEFSNIMSVYLTEKVMLGDLMKRYSKAPMKASEHPSPSLFDFDNLPENAL